MYTSSVAASRHAWYAIALFFLTASFALAIAANVIGFVTIETSGNFLINSASGALKGAPQDLMIAGNVFSGLAFVCAFVVLAFINHRDGYLATTGWVLVMTFIAFVLLIAGCAEHTDLAKSVHPPSFEFGFISIEYANGLWVGWASAATEFVALIFLVPTVATAASL